MMFGLFRSKEARASSGMTVTQSSPRLVEVLGLSDFMSAAGGVTVTVETALSVPAVWAAVNFLSGTLAGLPLHVYRREKDGRKRLKTGVAPILHGAVNDEMSSFEWRKYTFDRVFTSGRGFTFIERNDNGRVTNLWPLDPQGVTVKKSDGRRTYVYREDGRDKRFAASEIIDIPFMGKADMVSHRAPIAQCRDAIGRAIAATQYASKFYQSGGVPPFAVTGNFQSADAMRRASDDLAAAVSKAAKEERQALVMPAGLDIKQIGGDPEKSQLVEVSRFCIEEIARIYQMPPVFLQDLTHGTFSNTEQQDLHFVKHTIKRWVEQAEQEMSLKLFGRGSNAYVEFAVDGLLRGDYKTRMDGHASAVQNGIMTPNEARDMENRPALEGGDDLMIQGATVPIKTQGQSTGEQDDL